MDTRKQLNFAWLLVFSFFIFNAGFIAVQSLAWTDHWIGFLSGVFHTMFWGIIWIGLLLPWSLAVLGLYHWMQWVRFRAFWVLLPSFFFFAMNAGGIILDTPTPQKRFQAITKVSLPGTAFDLKWSFAGGPLADRNDLYSFSCQPEQTKQLIAELKIEKDEDYLNTDQYPPVSNFSGSRHIHGKPGAKLYHLRDEGRNLYIDLLTDETQQSVEIQITSM